MSLFPAPMSVEPTGGLPVNELRGVSRRSLLRGAAAVAVIGGPAAVLSAQAAEASVPARKADDLADTLGVVCVTSTTRGVWGKTDLVKARLNELGVRHIRNRLFEGNSHQVRYMRELGAMGIRMNLLMGDPTNKGGTPEQLVRIAAENLTSVASSFEGANEWNIQGGSNWVSELRAHQTRVYRAAKADRRTAGIPVLGPSLAQQYKDHPRALGNLSHVLDRGNIHSYTGGQLPSHDLDERLAAHRVVAGSAPIMITETGWHNARYSPATHRYTSEEVAGVYAPRQLLEYFNRRVERAFIYEFVDEPFAEPAQRDHEAHFGLIRNDFSRKPAFTALANLLALVSDRGTSFSPGSLAFEVRNAPGDLRKALVQKRNGSFVLFLWRDVEIWDSKREVNLPVRPATLSLVLPGACDLKVFRPTYDNAPKQTASAARGMTLQVGADVVAIQIDRR